MRITSLFTRSRTELPGITGTARVDRRTRDLLSRIKPGEIAVLDQTDLDQATAQALVRADIAGVINASSSISGRFPCLGPETLLDADIWLLDDIGAESWQLITDGSTLRVHDDAIYLGGSHVATGKVQTRASVADLMSSARAGMSIQLEAFSANTVEFLKRERSLILDGMGIPELQVPIRGRPVLVVAPGADYTEDLRGLKRYISDDDPVLFGVATAADTMRDLGYVPDVVVGEPNDITTETLESGAELVVPAQLDGHAPGTDRIYDLGLRASTFPASGNSEDLALLLAEEHDADLVVTVGFRATLHEFLDYGRSASNPSTFLTRLKLGAKLVDGKVVATLHRRRIRPGVVLGFVGFVVMVVAAGIVVLMMTGATDTVFVQVEEFWESLVSWFHGLMP